MGDIPRGWLRVTVGSIYEFEYGKSLTKSKRNSSGEFPVYGSNGIVGYHDSFIVDAPCLIVGRKGAAGAVSYSTKACWPIDTTYFVRQVEHLDTRFSYYLLRSIQLNKYEKSTAIPGLNRNDAYAEACLLPPLNEQRRIVAKIEELFSKIDKGVESLQTAKAQLQVYRQALLKHAFEGKLTAQWRADNPDKVVPAAQLLSQIQQAREERYQQQLADWKTAVEKWELGGKAGKKPSKPKKLEALDIVDASDTLCFVTPDSWLWLRYGSICEVVRNGISQKPEGKQGTKIFRISAVRPMSFDMNDYRFIDNYDGRFDRYYLHVGDLVFTRYNGSRRYVGVCAEYRSKERRLFPDKLIQTRLVTDTILSSYVEKSVNCGESRKYIESKIRTTAGQAGISGGDVKSIPLPLCSKYEQREIVELLDEKLSVIEKNEELIDLSLQEAEALRQSILKKAFSGQLVPQDSTDEPASQLLARIQAEKAARETDKTANQKNRRPRKTKMAL